MLDVERRVGVSLAPVLAAGACAGDAGAIHRGYSARAERDGREASRGCAARHCGKRSESSASATAHSDRAA